MANQPPPPPTPADPPAASSPFQPLFTLVSTSPSSSNAAAEYHHPQIHYLFSDDPDPQDAITSACLNTLTPSEPLSPSHSTQDPRTDPDHGLGTSTKKKEKFLILDLDASGTKITSSASLSPDWQILSAEIKGAPSWEGGEGEGEGRLMLEVKGVGLEGGGRVVKGKERGGKEGEGDNVMGLVEEFEKRMEGLRGVVGIGEKGEGA